MKLQIDDIKLKLLLEQKKEFIGKRITLENVCSSVSFLVSVVIAEYKDVFGLPGLVLKYLFIGLGLFFSFRAGWDYYNSKKNKYTFEDLLEDVNKLNEVEEYHSIVVIKDTYNEYSNRFLVYDDKRWDCLFFINYDDSEDNESFITNHLSNALKINSEYINITKDATHIHEKTSKTSGINKLYRHTFYEAKIDKFPEDMRRDKFTIDDIDYYWMTINELEQDERVKKTNSDLVKSVKELY